MMATNFNCLFLFLLLVKYTAPSEITKSPSDNHELRGKRSLIYRLNSATGILIAIAVPLDIPHHTVFMSYNFEANYNMPTVSQDIAPGIWQRLDLPGVITTEATGRAVQDQSHLTDSVNNTESHQTKRNIDNTREPLLSRMKTYQIFESKLNAAGLNGTECLLRAICDNAAHPVNLSNGILGDVIHIILSPSTSKDEYLNRAFHEAEIIGRQLSENCTHIYKLCPESVYDRLSKVL